MQGEALVDEERELVSLEAEEDEAAFDAATMFEAGTEPEQPSA